MIRQSINNQPVKPVTIKVWDDKGFKYYSGIQLQEGEKSVCIYKGKECVHLGEINDEDIFSRMIVASVHNELIYSKGKVYRDNIEYDCIMVYNKSDIKDNTLLVLVDGKYCICDYKDYEGLLITCVDIIHRNMITKAYLISTIHLNNHLCIYEHDTIGICHTNVAWIKRPRFMDKDCSILKFVDESERLCLRVQTRLNNGILGFIYGTTLEYNKQEVIYEN